MSVRERKRKGQKEDKISIEVRDEEKLVLIYFPVEGIAIGTYVL